MATNRLGLPPLPEGFVIEETPMPPLPPGFELESPKLETVKVSDLFPKEDQPPKIDDSQPSLRAAPEPTVGKKFKNFIRNIFEDKTETNVKGQMIYQISQDTGRSLRDVEKNYDLLIRDPKITGIQPDPTTMESIETAFTGAVTVGLATNPISTALGVASFMALDEAENAIISAVTDEEYELGGGKNISDLLPDDATRTSKEFVEILDLIGKGMIIGGVRNRTKGAFGRLSEQVTKKYIDEYKLPQDIYMDAGKVRSVLRGGKKDKFSPEEKDLLLDLNLSGSQYRKALSDGVTIRVPAEKVTKLVDRAWWGKVKETFGKPKSSEVVIRERAGELTEAPRGLLTEGRPITQPKVEPPRVAKPAQPPLEKPLVSTGNYKDLKAPKYVTDFLMDRVSSMTINDGGSIGHTNNKTTKTMLGKLIKQGFVEGNVESGYRLTEKGKQAKDQVAQNEKLAKEGVLMDYYSQKKVTKDPLMNDMNVLVGKMDGKPAYSNGHYLIKGKPSPETSISPSNPPFDPVIPPSSASDPIANPIGWFQSSAGKLVVLSDGVKHSAIDSKYYDFIKSKFPNSDFRLTTEGKDIKVAYSKEPIDRRLNKVSIYSSGERVGVIMPVRSDKLSSVVANLTNQSPAPLPTQPRVEKPKIQAPKLTQRESQELSDLKANLNTTFERLADPNRTNAQLLQDQRSAQRMIKLIQDKEPEFQAPELPFESDIKDVDASSLRQANIEASERVQHFSDTKAAKERVEDVERVSRAEITQFLRNAFDVTIRGKATYKMKGVAGFFSPVTKTVRSAITDDIYVLSHEVAHFIDNKIWGNQPKQRPHFRPWQNELGKLDYDPTKQRTSEGFAEFIRHFVSTGKAKELAPTFYDYFVGDFAKAHPKIYEDILKLRDLMTRYNKQGSVERVKSQINFEGKAPEQPLIKTVQDKSLNFRKQFLDDLAPLEDVYKRESITELSPDKDPLMLMRVFKGKARSKAEMAIRYNTTDYVGRITGKGLVDVIKPVSKTKKELEDFLAYAYARRALSRPDIDAGIELTDAQFVFDKYDSKKFREASDELSGFADRVLEYYVDSRGMSPETRDKIKSLNPVYLPLYRFFSDEPRFRSKASRVSGGKPVKGLKGSGRQILNPIESMIRYVENIYSAADKTRVAIAIKDAVDQGVLPGTLIEKVPPPTDIKKMKLNTLINTLEKEGFGVFNSVDPQTGELFRKQPSGSEMITLFTVGKRYFGKDNIIPIYEGENVSFYELDPRLHEMLQGLDHYQIHPALDFFLGAPTRLMKLGAVGLNAGFTFITNPIRDLSTYMLFSKSKVPNPAAPMVGLAADLGLGSKAAKDASRRFKAMGGDQATIYGRDRSARYKQMVSRIINEAAGTNISKVKNVVLNPVDALRRIFQTPELAPRIAEMQNKTKDYEKIYGKDSDAAYIRAFRDAQDVTINFSMMGNVSQYLNQMIPFFNPTIRGGEKLYREAKENPMRLIVRGVSTITVPALYFWYQNKDKEWYQKLPSELKYSQIHIDTGDFGGSGDIISLPLPHEVGTLFGGIPMAYWDEMYDIDKEGVEEALKLSLRQLNPGTPLDLSVIKPFMLVASNKTWYGAPLETRSMQRKEIPDRYTDYTIPMAKVLSRWMYDNIGAYEFASPVKIEAFANAATGGLTKNINDIVTFSNKEIESKADLPVVGKLFLRKEVYENRPAFDFERFKLLNQKKVSKTITPEQQIELRKLEAEYKQYTRNRKRRELQKEMEQNTP